MSSSPPSPKRAWPNCSEADFQRLADELAGALAPGCRVSLEGPMGAGKSTLARALLRALGVSEKTEGSPTFAIVHEYTSGAGVEISHADLYRLKDESEIEHAGLEEQFWDEGRILICEWLDRFPGFRKSVLGGDGGFRNWRVSIRFAEDPSLRDVEISGPADHAA